MKILEISKNYGPDKGGIENYVFNLVQGLTNKHKVTVLAFNDKNKTEEFKEGSLRVLKLGTPIQLRSQPISIKIIKEIKKLSKESDIVHLNVPNPLAEFAYLLSGSKKRLVITFHSEVVKQKLLGKIYKPISNKILKKASRIIVASKKMAENTEILRKFSDKIVIIPYGINITHYKDVDNKEVSKIVRKHGKNIVLFVGRLIYYKGIQNLIEAMKDLPEAKLLIIGEGNLENILKKQVKHLKLRNVLFLGKIKDLVPYYHACKVFVLPSTHKTESFGIVQIEAMACGKPVVCTELGTGTSWVNQDGITGFVVPPSNPKALARSIKKILNDKELYKKLSNNAYGRAKTVFNVEKMIKKHVEVFSK